MNKVIGKKINFFLPLMGGMKISVNIKDILKVLALR